MWLAIRILFQAHLMWNLTSTTNVMSESAFMNVHFQTAYRQLRECESEKKGETKEISGVHGGVL